MEVGTFPWKFIAFLLLNALSVESKQYKDLIYFIESFGKWVLVIISAVVSILISLAIYNHYKNLNSNWNTILVKNGKYAFKKYNKTNILYKQKIFSTNRLEKLQSNVLFKHSEYYLKKLQKENLLKNDILEYNNKLLFSNYIINDEYKTLFIVKKVDDNQIVKFTDMYIIFTKKDIFKEEYQIIDVITKKLNIQYLDRYTVLNQ